MGFIIVTYFRISTLLFTLIIIVWGPIRSAQRLLHGVSSAKLAGNLQINLTIFLCCQVLQLLTSFWETYLNPFQHKYWLIIASVLFSPGWKKYV